MPRPPRPQVAALWHMINRGVLKKDIYRDAADRQKFLEILAEVVLRFGWVLHAFVEMTNHFHLLAETPAYTISKGLQLLEGWYGSYFRARWPDRQGHLFEKRAFTVQVNQERHLAETARYIVLNPVRADFVQSPEQWKWSSYRATAGLITPPPYLNVTATRSLFGGDSEEALVKFKQFVRAGIGAPPPWAETKAQYFQGKAALVTLPTWQGSKSARASIAPASPETVVAAIAKAFALSEEEVLEGTSEAAVLAFAYLARIYAQQTTTEIAQCLGISQPTASRRCSAAARLVETDGFFRIGIERAMKLLNSVTNPRSTTLVNSGV